MTSLETRWNSQDEKAMHVFDGWFKAPETGDYRFFIQADDQYKLFLDAANPWDPVNPPTTSLTEIGQQWYFKGWREYHHTDPNQGKFVTDWIQMTGGSYYKIRGVHKDGGGGMFSTVSMEYKKDGSTFTDKPMASKAVQSWRIEQTNVAEEWTLTVAAPSTGKYKLGLKSPKESTTWFSNEIDCDAPAWELRNRLYPFFSANSRTGSDISVTLTMYDSSNVVT